MPQFQRPIFWELGIWEKKSWPNLKKIIFHLHKRIDWEHILEKKIFYVTHNCFGPQSLLVEGLLSTGPTPSSFYPLHLFPAYMRGELDQLFIKRNPHKDLKWTKSRFGPIQTCLEAFLGFLVETNKKAYTKMISFSPLVTSQYSTKVDAYWDCFFCNVQYSAA